MSAETFVFTQLQSGALPTELSEVVPPTRLHYLTLIKPHNPVLAPCVRVMGWAWWCRGTGDGGCGEGDGEDEGSPVRAHWRGP